MSEGFSAGVDPLKGRRGTGEVAPAPAETDYDDEIDDAAYELAQRLTRLLIDAGEIWPPKW